MPRPSSACQRRACWRSRRVEAGLGVSDVVVQGRGRTDRGADSCGTGRRPRHAHPRHQPVGGEGAPGGAALDSLRFGRTAAAGYALCASNGTAGPRALAAQGQAPADRSRGRRGGGTEPRRVRGSDHPGGRGRAQGGAAAPGDARERVRRCARTSPRRCRSAAVAGIKARQRHRRRASRGQRSARPGTSSRSWIGPMVS